MESSTVAHDAWSSRGVAAGSSAAGPPNDAAAKAQAVADLLRDTGLRHSLGRQGEYEVRTTITMRQAWSYRCDVRCQGKAIRREFLPIVVDRTRQMRQEPVITEAMRMAFAEEAVEVHCARCAAVAEYTLLAPIVAGPPRRRWRPWMAVATVVIAALLTGYGVWGTRHVAEVEPRPARGPVSLAPGSQQSVSTSPIVETPPALSRLSPYSSPQQSSVVGTPEPAGDMPGGLLLTREPLPGGDGAAHVATRADRPLPPVVPITGGTVPRRTPPLASSKALPAGRSAAPDCLLKMLKGEPCEGSWGAQE